MIIQRKISRELPVPISPGDIARKITGRDYLSYSQVTTYQACKLKWWFTYVEEAKPEQTSAAMLLGSAVHSAIQHHLQASLAGEPHPTLDELMDVYRAAWKQEAGDTPVQFAKEDDAGTLQEMAKNMLGGFLESPHAHPTGQIIAIEQSLRIKLAENLPDLLAKVDLLEDRGDELVVTDYKAARSMWSSTTAGEHSEQLLLYGHAAEPIAKDLNRKIRLEFVVLTKAKSPRVASFTIQSNSGRLSRTKHIVTEVFESMQSGVVYPSPSTLNCRGCPHRRRCANWPQLDPG